MDSLFPREHAIEPLDGDKGREERGAFYTPDKLALAICQTLREKVIAEPKNIFEPGCGGGAFLRAVHATWPRCWSIFGIDLEPARGSMALDSAFTVMRGDLFKVQDKFSLIVGNPDFANAEAIARHCLAQLAPGGYLAFLLLAAIEESNDRNIPLPPGFKTPFWVEHPLYLRQAIGQRPSFRPDGKTDMRPYALHVWKEGHAGEYRGLRPLVWR